ncbi:MAG: hypothetical protein N2Z65_06565 [Clostridiales bacterium]|nr:hypothetical protein [Clostridiales bacterium]
MDANFQGFLEEYIRQENRVTLTGTVYSLYPKLVTEGIKNGSQDVLTLIVPDEAVQDGSVHQSILCFNCSGNTTKVQDRFTNALNAAQSASGLGLKAISKNEILAQEGGSKAIISFVGIYVGIVFLITSAAVLALQQLSEAADNKQRYAVLQKIGADDKLLNRTILKQTAIYFLIPLAVACIHSIVGIKVANDAIRMVGSLDARTNILITAVAILTVYGAYFLATYIGNRNIILKSKILSSI